MDKEFIPYTEALALKELGFDESCFAIWSGIDELNFSVTDTIRLYSSAFSINGNQSSKFYINDFNSLRVAAPTFSQAFRWFREKYDIQLGICHIHGGFDCWTNDGDLFENGKYCNFKTYEEAEIACLEKLIEIVENK
jgi:hypothetical protein